MEQGKSEREKEMEGEREGGMPNINQTHVDEAIKTSRFHSREESS